IGEDGKDRLFLDRVDEVLREVRTGIGIALDAGSLRQRTRADRRDRIGPPIVGLGVRRILPESYVELVEIVEWVRDGSVIGGPVPVGERKVRVADQLSADQLVIENVVPMPMHE